MFYSSKETSAMEEYTDRNTKTFIVWLVWGKEKPSSSSEAKGKGSLINDYANPNNDLQLVIEQVDMIRKKNFFFHARDSLCFVGRMLKHGYRNAYISLLWYIYW